MSNALEQLKKHSIVVADTADFSLLQAFQPEDATTNPSLVLAGSELPAYSNMISDAITAAKEKLGSDADADAIVEYAVDLLTVSFGLEILKYVPGRVSTEVDAKLSFDKEAMIARAKHIIELYAAKGISKDRIYIKLASTWEGIQAAKELEKEGIACNLTLLFSFAQAVACAQAGVALISPFVGRVLDWHKAKTPNGDFAGEKDPGVISVRAIYAYYKKYGYKTIVMGASFRNTGEILEIAGCDKLTISPKLLKELEETTGVTVERKLSAEGNDGVPVPSKLPELSQADFLFMHNEDAMGVEKLAEGIRNFNKDTRKLEAIIKQKL